jgi:hypothetical protein
MDEVSEIKANELPVWPNFFLVGAAKAGTSSVYAYLRQHPDVFLPDVKEPHFFSQVVAVPQFQPVFYPAVLKEADYVAMYRHAGAFAAVGDASVSYLWDPQAPYRIVQKVKEARILMILREPVERAYSQYLANVREGVEDLPFYEALLANRKETSYGWGTSRLYIETGLYSAQVQRYYDLFPPENICVLNFGDLKRDAAAVLHRVARFLQIDPDPVCAIRTEEIHNPHLVHRGDLAARIMRSRALHLMSRRLVPRRIRAWARYSLLLQPGPKPPIDPRAVTMLRDLYEPDLEELERVMGQAMPDLRRLTTRHQTAATGANH